jgi:thymidine kinase
MAKLYFYYSAMNAGKTTMLLQAAYNYKERGMSTLLLTPAIDTRYGPGKIHSRIGLEAHATSFTPDHDLLAYTITQQAKQAHLACLLVDEAQFLTKKQVLQLTRIVDELNLPVLAYGLRSDFQGEPFIGSLYLLIYADHLIEMKTICHCGKKAIMTARINAAGQAIKTGEQIQIGNNEHYIAVCRKHFKSM